MSRLAAFVRTGAERSYTDAPTAGSIWDCALGSDSGTDGLEQLIGLDSDEPATVTVVARSLGYDGHKPYQGPQVSRVDVGGRTVYLGEVGYSEGYLYALRATEADARDTVPCSSGWAGVRAEGPAEAAPDPLCASELACAVADAWEKVSDPTGVYSFAESLKEFTTLMSRLDSATLQSPLRKVKAP